MGVLKGEMEEEQTFVGAKLWIRPSLANKDYVGRLLEDERRSVRERVDAHLAEVMSNETLTPKVETVFNEKKTAWTKAISRSLRPSVAEMVQNAIRNLLDQKLAQSRHEVLHDFSITA